TKSDVEGAVERLKKSLEGDDAQEIKRLADELTQASHKLAEKMYAHASQGQGPSGDAGGSGPKEGPAGNDEVVDADFEEVKK
ncbi:MAG: molecular chaperone DnaK, partial [Deltaproteobacteria bacterium CG_4_10_14_3_um_filter_51_14]